jgi:hypothetical protein
MSQKLSVTIYFDGTGNNKDIDRPKEQHTNVARLFDSQNAQKYNLSYNSEGAPKQYDYQYDGQDLSGRAEAIYFDGVGSRDDASITDAYEGGTGAGWKERIDQAYDVITAFHNKYPDQDIDINMVGFSRGASQARALANVVIDKGIPELDGNGEPTGEYLIPPGDPHINQLAVFDTVASYDMRFISNTHLGMDLSIHKNVDATTHLVAVNEYRYTFPLTSAVQEGVNSNIHEVRFPGAHSQIGGGYPWDILAAGPLSYMYNTLEKSGLEMTPLPLEERVRIEKYNEIIQSPDLVLGRLIDSRLSNDSRLTGLDGKVLYSSKFPLEDEQNYAFENEVKGREVIFEQGDKLSKLFVVQGVEGLGGAIGTSFENVSEAFHKGFAGQKNHSESQVNKAFAEVDDVFENSRPTAENIQSFNYQPVDVADSNLISPAERKIADTLFTNNEANLDQRLIINTNISELIEWSYDHDQKSINEFLKNDNMNPRVIHGMPADTLKLSINHLKGTGGLMTDKLTSEAEKSTIVRLLDAANDEQFEALVSDRQFVSDVVSEIDLDEAPSNVIQRLPVSAVKASIYDLMTGYTSEAEEDQIVTIINRSSDAQLQQIMVDKGLLSKLKSELDKPDIDALNRRMGSIEKQAVMQNEGAAVSNQPQLSSDHLASWRLNNMLSQSNLPENELSAQDRASLLEEFIAAGGNEANLSQQQEAFIKAAQKQGYDPEMKREVDHELTVQSKAMSGPSM